HAPRPTPHGGERLPPHLGVVERAHDQAVEPDDDALAGQGDEADLLDLAGLEAHGGARGQVQAHAVGLLAVADEGAVDLEEVEVRADLHGPIAGVVDRDRDGRASGVQLDVRSVEQVFAGNHGRVQLMGWWTVTSLVPSGKVASTWISWIMSATPS